VLIFLRWLLVLGLLWPLYGGRCGSMGRGPPAYDGIVVLGALGFTASTRSIISRRTTRRDHIGILQGSIPIFVLAGAFLFQERARAS